MRLIALLIGLQLAAASSNAQEWEEYVNFNDGFKINFPGQPRVTTAPGRRR
jgi:hypothetical protein